MSELLQCLLHSDFRHWSRVPVHGNSIEAKAQLAPWCFTYRPDATGLPCLISAHLESWWRRLAWEAYTSAILGSGTLWGPYRSSPLHMTYLPRSKHQQHGFYFDMQIRLQADRAKLEVVLTKSSGREGSAVAMCQSVTIWIQQR
jgi:hypothetical protein